MLCFGRSEALSVTPEDLPRAAERFFSEEGPTKRIKRMEQEIAKLRTSGGDGGSTMVDGVRVIVQEVDADLKQLTNMLGAMTRDPEQPTVAVWAHAKVEANFWSPSRKERLQQNVMTP